MLLKMLSIGFYDVYGIFAAPVDASALMFFSIDNNNQKRYVLRQIYIKP